MLPVEFDVSVGIHGQRVSWRYENMVPISDENAVRLVQRMQEALWGFLSGLESPATAGESTEPTVVPGSVVSAKREGRATSRPSRGAPKFDPDEARERAARAI